MIVKLYDVEIKVQAFTLTEYEVSTKIVTNVTNLSMQSVTHLQQTAWQHNYDSENLTILLTKYVENSLWSDHSKKIISEQKKAVIDKVKKNCYNREMFTAELRDEFKFFLILMLHILYKSRFHR